jgi:hypothetical protein
MATGRSNIYVVPGTTGLLFIEPALPPSPQPLVDGATRRMAAHLRGAERGDSGYRGIHTCSCGARSDNTDHVVAGRFTTNSLAAHYLAHHRAEVPADELVDVLSLPAVCAEPTAQELAGGGRS